MYKCIFDEINKNFCKINSILTAEKNNKYLRKKLNMVDIYREIQSRYRGCKIDPTFEGLYSSFYMMNRFVTDSFKKAYFQILKDASKGEKFTHDAVAERLEGYKNTRGEDRYQLSFISKLLHTIDDSVPIYDRNIRKVLHLSAIKGSTYSDKVENGKIILGKISSIYDEFSKDSFIIGVISGFTSLAGIGDVKKCDFLLWAYYYMKHI